MAGAKFNDLVAGTPVDADILAFSLAGASGSRKIRHDDFSDNLSFLQLGTGAVRRTLKLKNRDFVNVFDFMLSADINTVKNNGVIDVTYAWQAAHDALSSGGGFIVAGTGTHTLATVNISKPCGILSQGSIYGGCIIVPLNITGDIFNVTASGFYAKNLQIISAVSRSSGAYLNLTNSSYCLIDGFRFARPFTGIESDGGSINVIMNGHIRDATSKYLTAGAAGIYLGRNSQGTTNIISHVIMDTSLLETVAAGSFIVGVSYQILTAGSTSFTAIGSANNTVGTIFTATGVGSGTGTAVAQVVNANSMPSYGVAMGWQDALTLHASSFIRSGYNLAMIPGTGQSNTNNKFSKSFFDSGNIGILMQPTGSGAIAITEFDHCEASSGLLYGTLVDSSVCAGSGGFISGTTFTKHEGNQSINHGIYVTDPATTETVVDGGRFAGNLGSGVFFEANLTRFTIRDARCGASGNIAANGAYGLVIGTGCSQYAIYNNNFRLNTTAGFLKNSSSSSGVVYNNKGYNPLGPAGITVTASPFTYTADNTPESIYIDGGTVSAIALGGTTMFANTGHTLKLAPNQVVTVTYTVAPTMNKNIE